LLIENLNLNLITNPGDSFIIHANLNPGDKFYNPYFGNITIISIERRIFAGAERTVVSGATNYTRYYWDRQTGVLVQSTSSIPEGVMGDCNFTVFTKTSGTDIWQPQILGLDLNLFYAIIIVVVSLAAIVAFLVWCKRTPPKLVMSSDTLVKYCECIVNASLLENNLFPF
jgi:hypothetical protein